MNASTTVAGFSPDTWGLIAYIAAVFGLVGLMLGLSWVLGGRSRGQAKHEQFEAGVVPAGATPLRVSAKFYLVAMFFVIFDLEAAFLYAWAVAVRPSGRSGFIEAAIFIAVLLIALFYVWRVGGLDWAPQRSDIEKYRFLRDPNSSELHTHPSGK